ncbi:MAG TPA: hypothetical protein VLA19_22685 [Herpetosiphonaceae bacterium]|nr:hypothetical protein [Herpetosiphonaceae bacterium]
MLRCRRFYALHTNFLAIVQEGQPGSGEQCRGRELRLVDVAVKLAHDAVLVVVRQQRREALER